MFDGIGKQGRELLRELGDVLRSGHVGRMIACALRRGDLRRILSPMVDRGREARRVHRTVPSREMGSALSSATRNKRGPSLRCLAVSKDHRCHGRCRLITGWLPAHDPFRSQSPAAQSEDSRAPGICKTDRETAEKVSPEPIRTVHGESPPCPSGCPRTIRRPASPEGGPIRNGKPLERWQTPRRAPGLRPRRLQDRDR